MDIESSSFAFDTRHQGVQTPQIILHFFCHPSLLVIAFGKPSRRHPIFTQRGWMQVFTGWPKLHSWEVHHHHATSADLPDPLATHLLSIAPGKSSRLCPVSAQSCCMSFIAGCPAFARPCEGVHRSISLMSSSLLLQQFPRMSGLSNLESFCDGCYVAIQLLFCGVLPPGLVQYYSQYSCVIAVKLFLHI